MTPNIKDGLYAYDVGRIQREFERPPGAAYRPPDAVLSPVDAAFLGVEDRLCVVVAERDRLTVQVATLERHLTRALESGTIWCNEALADQVVTRRVSYLAAALFIALVWREGYHVGLWLWRSL